MCDWLETSHKLTLYFVLETQENEAVFPTEAIKPPGEVQLLAEKVLSQLT